MGRRRRGRAIDGWLVIDKPAGIGSTTVVGRVRWALDAAKAGHAGTLDPDATGVLAVALGEATKTVPHVTGATKGYRFRVAWGARTATDDASGAVIETCEARPSRQAVEAALEAFRGDIVQVPPRVSAVKVDGARAYDLARGGVAMDLAARPLRVERLVVVAADADGAELEMTCGKGGYVRAICRDLGAALGCLGHAAWLRRTWSGPFAVGDAVPLATLEAEARTPALDARLLPLETGLRALAEVPVDAAAADRLRHGNPVAVDAPDAAPAWASLDGRAVAIGACEGGAFRPTKVIAAPVAA